MDKPENEKTNKKDQDSRYKFINMERGLENCFCSIAEGLSSQSKVCLMFKFIFVSFFLFNLCSLFGDAFLTQS